MKTFQGFRRTENKETETALTLPKELPPDHIPTPPEGLTDEAAAALRESGASNAASSGHGKSVWRILADNLFTLFNLLNLLLALALLFVGAYRNMLFLGVVISNTLIGTVQELRAKKTVEKLKLLSESPVKVRRQGRILEIPPSEAVKGDVVLLKTGDQVCADAIMTGGICDAGEALLTGEQDAIHKNPGDWLYSGSFITGGSCECQLEYVGDESYINRLSASAKKIIAPKSALMTDLRKIVRLVSVLLIPIGIALFCKQYFGMGASLSEAIPSSVAAMVGMIPEGLMLLSSVALAAGVVKLGRKKTLVQELYGIETLARTDMLCLDKTGTITTGSMILKKFIPADGVNEVQFTDTLSRFLGAVDASAPTLFAIAKEVAPRPETPAKLIPFSSARKYTCVTFSDGMTVIVGAPSFALREKYDDGTRALVEAEAKKGYRVLAAAECEGAIEGEEAPPVRKILGLCVISDEIRKEAPECLRYFKEQGVNIKIISGDDPITVAAIAEEAGLEGASLRAVDASSLTDEEIDEKADEYIIFGRVTPDRKRKLIMALKKAGHNVAMTGDGVNDIPAMKCADCSIAMASGSDAARHAAQLILLDNNFACLPEIVSEGRRVINNIGRTASLFLVKTIYSFLLGILMIILPAAYPFQPIQLTLVSSLTIGLPSFFLALEPNSERVRGNFLKTVLLRALPGGISVTVCAAAASMMESVWPREVCSTVATVSAGIIGLLMLISVSLPFSKLRAIVCASMAVLFSAGVIFFGHIFFLTPLGWQQLLALLGITLFGAAVIFISRYFYSRNRKLL
jgi:cation-transporting ATPase E